jgi:hypothetical protein
METSETLVRILETVVQTNTQMVETLLRMEQRQQEHNQALAQILDRMDARTQEIQRRTEDIDARIAADNRALAEILKYIADTTSRTEQMTARILTEVSKGASH